MIHRRLSLLTIVLVAGLAMAAAAYAVNAQEAGKNVDVPKKIMQINVCQDGTMEILDVAKTEAAGKPVSAEETNWKEFHEYLKGHEAKQTVAEDQLTLLVTNPCCWVKINNTWYVICW